MKRTREDINNPFDVSEDDARELGFILYQKDYTADALSFLSNYSRILNYWGEGTHDLLPPKTNEGRRRFSLLDLIWLGIVKESRDFGMEKEAIYKLKEELFDTSDIEGFTSVVKTDRALMEQTLRDQFGINSLQAKAMIDDILEKQATIRELKLSRLFSLVANALKNREPLYLLVNKEGSHCPLLEKIFPHLLAVPAFTDFFRKPHLSICINQIIGFFLSKDYIKDSVKQALFSEQEWKIIETIRKEKPKMVTIYFTDGGVTETIEVTKKIYISLEARISEIMARGGYEKLELVTQNGKPVYALKTKNIKL